jgi:tetratricopeptide (TPR) repeat protein
MKASPMLWGIVLLVSVLYSFKTIARNKDWKNDYELFSRDIKHNPNSTHLLFYMGNHLPSEDRKEVLTDILSRQGYSLQQINDSISKEVNLSIDFFRRSLNIYPYLPADGYNQLGKAYFIKGQLDSAYKYYTKAKSEDTTSGIYTNNVGTVYFNRAQYADALPLFTKAHYMDTTEADFMNNIGCVYGVAQQADSAIYWFKKAQKADSLDIKSLQFLDVTYRNLGDTATADYYRSRMMYVQQLRRERL